MLEIRGNMDSASLSTKTLRKLKKTGQCRSKERDFKEYKKRL
jgi:hypothetical protein